LKSLVLNILRTLLPEIFGAIFGITAIAFAYFLFSLFFLAIEEFNHLDMTDNMNPLSIGAIVAITLFIIKEVLEAYRKNASKNRKIKALKTILAEEIKLNYWVWKQIESIVKKVKEMPPETLYQIISSTSGTERFEYVRPDGGGGGIFVPEIKDQVFTQLITEIAELDEDFYSRSIEYGKGVAELQHLRHGVFDFIHETPKGEHYAEGFCEYALDELPDIKDKFQKLYIECTGDTELQHRMR
tara:strand:+ start:145 stop:870 length:726 start_codon:yes stop_codon:yes gene_type:complete